MQPFLLENPFETDILAFWGEASSPRSAEVLGTEFDPPEQPLSSRSVTEQSVEVERESLVELKKYFEEDTYDVKRQNNVLKELLSKDEWNAIRGVWEILINTKHLKIHAGKARKKLKELKTIGSEDNSIYDICLHFMLFLFIEDRRSKDKSSDYKYHYNRALQVIQNIGAIDACKKTLLGALEKAMEAHYELKESLKREHVKEYIKKRAIDEVNGLSSEKQKMLKKRKILDVVIAQNPDSSELFDRKVERALSYISPGVQMKNVLLLNKEYPEEGDYLESLMKWINERRSQEYRERGFRKPNPVKVEKYLKYYELFMGLSLPSGVQGVAGFTQDSEDKGGISGRQRSG